MRRFILCLALPLVLASCSRTVSLSVLRPAEVDVPSRIKKLAVINRTTPVEKSSKVFNVLEGVVSGEGFLQDHEAGLTAMDGCVNSMNQGLKYKASKVNKMLPGTGTALMTPVYSWDSISRLCNEHGADAIVALECIDSDFNKAYYTDTIKEKDKKGNEVVKVRERTEKNVKVNSGWRLYDPKERKVIDETFIRTGSKITKDYKESSLTLIYDPEKRSETDRVSFDAGYMYALRITPHFRKEHLEYYHKGHEDLERAGNLVMLNDWKGAVVIWKGLLNHEKAKIRKRALYNLITASEMLNNLDAALEWAEKGYKEFGSSRFLDYVQRIKIRIADIDRLKYQLGAEEYAGLTK